MYELLSNEIVQMRIIKIFNQCSDLLFQAPEGDERRRRTPDISEVGGNVCNITK